MNTRFEIKMHTAGVAFYQERVFLIHGQRQGTSSFHNPLTLFLLNLVRPPLFRDFGMCFYSRSLCEPVRVKVSTKMSASTL